MASINEYLSKILSARYGKDVRQSIHDSINAINTQVESAENSTMKNANIASESAKSAAESETNAKASEELAEQYKNAAFSGTPEGYEQLVGDVALLDIQTSTEKALMGSKPGGLKINTITGESRQKSYTGKNLLENVGATATVNGVTFTVNEDGSVTANGTATEESIFVINTSLSCEANTEYVLSGGFIGGSDSTYYLALWNSGWQRITTTYGSEIKFTSPSDGIVRARILIRSGVTVSDLTFYPMIRLSSIMDDTYEPYVGGIASPNPEYPQDIESVVISKVKTYGRNLVNWGNNNYANKVSNVKFENDILSFDYNGGYTNIGYSVTYLRGKRVKLDCESITNTNTSAVTCLQFVITRPNGTKKYEQITTGGSLTLPSDSTNINLQVMGNNASVDRSGTLTIKKPLIHIYGIDTTYEPYSETAIELSEPIILNGIGDVKDQIIKKDGVWGVQRRFAEVTFDGSEGWVISSTNVSGAYRNRLTIADIKPVSTIYDLGKVLCKRYSVIPTASTGTYGANVGLSVGTGNVIDIYDDNYNTNDVTIWKSHLANNPLLFLYELATPTFEPLPTSDQIALNSLLTFDTVTNINFYSPVEPKIDVEYGTSKVGGYGLQSLLLLENVKKGLETQYLSEVNLNDYITPMTAICDFCAGVPYNDESGSIGLLEVFRNYPMGYILQRYTYYGGHIYIRRCDAYTGNVWSEWIQIS